MYLVMKTFLIYNSRNYKGVLIERDEGRGAEIYNSRNYKGVLILSATLPLLLIYNSRNYKGVLIRSTDKTRHWSTTVEIIREY